MCVILREREEKERESENQRMSMRIGQRESVCVRVYVCTCVRAGAPSSLVQFSGNILYSNLSSISDPIASNFAKHAKWPCWSSAPLSLPCTRAVSNTQRVSTQVKTVSWKPNAICASPAHRNMPVPLLFFGWPSLSTS